MSKSLDQSLYLASNMALDSKLQPLSAITDLKNITMADRYEGMSVVVLNDGNPIEFYLVGGTKNYNWRVKLPSVFDTYSNLMTSVSTIVSNLKTSKNASQAFVVGTEVVVSNDDNPNSTNYGKLSKYWITGFDEDGSAIWERKIYTDEVIPTIADIEAEIDKLKAGQIVYVSEKQYSWVDESGETHYTTDEEKAKEAVGEDGTYDTIDVGSYVNNEGSLDKIVTEDSGAVTIEGEDTEPIA